MTLARNVHCRPFEHFNMVCSGCNDHMFAVNLVITMAGFCVNDICECVIFVCVGWYTITMCCCVQTTKSIQFALSLTPSTFITKYSYIHLRIPQIT